MIRGLPLLLLLLLVLGRAGWPVAAQVIPGNEVLAGRAFRDLSNKRVGLITNPSGVTRDGRTTIDLLRRVPGVRLVALFGPEHGVYGDVQAGGKVTDGLDRRTGLPVHSLYGATRKPTPAMLRGLDALVYDLQDTGVRSYTFISTMGLAMEACAEAGVEFVVLDRPNPLGGLRVEGPMVDERFRSFVGQWNVPYVYGLTCGELAQMINEEGWIRPRCRLTIVPMRGWRRAMIWRDTGLRWVASSPNIPHAGSPLHYAATGLFGEIAGGSGISIGTGIGRPFEVVVAPWLDPGRLSAELRNARLPGLSFAPFSTYHNDRLLRGVELRITDPAHAPLVAVNYHLIEAVRRSAGRDLVAEAVRSGRNLQMFDKVNGTDSTRLALQSGETAARIVRSWQPGVEAFRKRREKYLLYEAPSPIQFPTMARPAGGPASGQERARPEPETKTLVWTKGDTAYRISRDYNVTLAELQAANPGVRFDRIRPGRKIQVPLKAK